MLYFEDLEMGLSAEQGQRRLTKAEIVDFATEYDPQSFHVDEAAATQSVFGGIVASGLQTLAVCNALTHEAMYRETAIVAGRGIDCLRFYEPVYPGDSLSVRVEVVERGSDDGRPEWGAVSFDVTGWNQRDDRVVAYTTLAFVQRRTENEG